MDERQEEIGSAKGANLKQLRLSGILDSLEDCNRQAIEGKLAYTEFLSLLIDNECRPPRPEEVRPAAAPRRGQGVGYVSTPTEI